MIRQTLGVDPYGLDDEHFAEYLSEALWLKQMERKQMTGAVLEALAIAFGRNEQ